MDCQRHQPESYFTFFFTEFHVSMDNKIITIYILQIIRILFYVFICLWKLYHVTFIFILMLVKMVDTIYLTVTRILLIKCTISRVSTNNQTFLSFYMLQTIGNLFYIIISISKSYNRILIFISMAVIIMNEIKVFNVSTSKIVVSETNVLRRMPAIPVVAPSCTILSTLQSKIAERLLLVSNKEITIMENSKLFSIWNVWQIFDSIWILISIIVITIVNRIFPQSWLDIIIITIRTDFSFTIYFLYQVSNFLFIMDIQTVVYINIFLKIIILHTYFIAMHALLFAVLILLLIFCIGVCLCEIVNEFLQQLIFQRFAIARVIVLNFKLILHISVFILIMVLGFNLSVLFIDNENKFDIILYLVKIATTITCNGLFINLYVFIIVVIFDLMINENDIIVYNYIYDIKYQFILVFYHNSGQVWNYSLLLNNIVFLQQIIVYFIYGINHYGLQQYLMGHSMMEFLTYICYK